VSVGILDSDECREAKIAVYVVLLKVYPVDLDHEELAAPEDRVP
jgi:hypothetical protein